MNNTDLQNLRSWFSQYTNRYSSLHTTYKEAYKLKIRHSAKVSLICADIGRSLNLNNGDIALAETIGLFHDIGRFEQFSRYHTFLDKKSENHAELGVKVLKEGQILNHLDGNLQEIIEKAISYHNRLQIPAEESPRIVLFSKLIRDADKLDIFDLVSTYYNGNGRSAVIELDLPDEPEYSTGMLSDLSKNKLVDIKKMRTLNDFKLLQLGWIYDLNFPITVKRIKERQYLEAIRKSLPVSKEIDAVMVHLNDYLNRQVGQG
ncbi:MAG: HD domain-containing protein [Syntrophales bacterium]